MLNRDGAPQKFGHMSEISHRGVGTAPAVAATVKGAGALTGTDAAHERGADLRETEITLTHAGGAAAATGAAAADDGGAAAATGAGGGAPSLWSHSKHAHLVSLNNCHINGVTPITHKVALARTKLLLLPSHAESCS